MGGHANMVEQIGPHRVRCGDVTDGLVIDQLMQGERADIMYTDPPWGDGNVRYWATKNRKDTGQRIVPVSNSSLLDAVFGIAERVVDRYLIVEYGIRWEGEIRARGVAAGFPNHTLVPVQYRSGSKLLPMHLHAFTRPGVPLPAGYAADVTSSHGYDCVRRAFLSLGLPRGGVALDPCCGMGYTARAALEAGLRFRGNELNKVRLGKTIARLKRSVADPTANKRFDMKVDKSGDCWLWTAHTNHRGYGQFNVNGRIEKAHRYAFDRYIGPIPPGLRVRHMCSVRACVNPDHLGIGTAKEDSDDKLTAGGHDSKLTQRDVHDIRLLLCGGHPQHKIAVIYGVTQTAISNIKAGKTWNHTAG